MTRLKDITFESGSLTGTNGADSALGSISLDSASAVKGTYSARGTAAGDFVREDFTAVDTVYVSMLLKITTLPASTQSRILFIRNVLSGIQCSVRLTSGGKLQLRDAGNTQVGSDSSTTLSTGTIYRVGLRYTKGTGSNAILEAYVAADGVAFGSAFASTSAATNTAQADRVEAGQSTGGTASDHFIDNIRIDDAAMPTDDVSGGTTYNQSVNITAGSSVGIIKTVNKPLSFTSVSVFNIQKQITRAISITVPVNVSVIKQAVKSFSMTVGNAVAAIQKQVNKNINAVVISNVSITKIIDKVFNITTSANVVLQKGLIFYKTISVAVSTSVNMQKNIAKIINIPVNVLFTMARNIKAFIETLGVNIGAFGMNFGNTGAQSLLGTDNKTISLNDEDNTLDLKLDDDTTI